MATEVIQVDDSSVVVALGKFRLSLQQHYELMREIGASQLVSVRRTFREQGSPANSWVPLSPNTIKRDPKRYGPGHKLLIGKGTLLNLITYAVQGNGVVIGTVLKYAAVHQFGSRDRGVAIGPQTKEQAGSTIKVGQSFARLKGPGYASLRLEGPALEGRNHPRLRVRTIGPKRLAAAHERHQNIPPRPYLVFRPEDPQRIRGIVVQYVNKAKHDAGLGGAQ
jgi:phage gpG-like protein